MYRELSLTDPGEMLVMFYFRPPGVDPLMLFATDFERRLRVQESGLSLLRPSYLSIRDMVAMTELRARKQARGLAYSTVRNILSLGFRFFGDNETSGHVCFHCLDCNGSERDCKCLSTICPLSASESPNVREMLASTFVIQFPPRPNADIFRALGTDLSGPPETVNVTYIHRWGQLISGGSEIPNQVLVVIDTKSDCLSVDFAKEVQPWVDETGVYVLDVFCLGDEIIQGHDRILSDFMAGRFWDDTDEQLTAVRDVRVQRIVQIRERLSKVGADAIFVPRLTERRNEIIQLLRDQGITVFTNLSNVDETNRRLRRGEAVGQNNAVVRF